MLEVTVAPAPIPSDTKDPSQDFWNMAYECLLEKSTLRVQNNM